MGLFYGSIGDLIIPDGATVSNILTSVHHFGDADALVIYGKTGLSAGTYTLEVNQDQEATAASSGWATYQDSAAASVKVPAADTAMVYRDLVAAGAFRIKASAPVTGTQGWRVNQRFVVNC